MTIKKNLTLKGSIILIIVAIILTISQVTYSKVRVNVDGTVNINFGKSRNENGRDRRNDYWDNNNYDAIGDITDYQYNMKPFILNDKGYSVIRDRGRLYILQVEFKSGNLNKVDREVIYDSTEFSSNCLAIAGDNRYCLTITVEGSPALWDRYSSRIKYTGRWLKNNNSYYDYNYDYDYYNNSNQSWFEW